MNRSRYSIVLFLFAICIANAQVDDSKLLIPSTSQGKEEASKYAQLIQKTYDQGEYELSKIYSDSLFFLSELYGIKDMSIMALNGQAIYHKNKGDSEKAIGLYHQALKRTDSLTNSEGPKAMVLANMSNIYTDIGAYKKSIATLDRLLVVTDTIRSFSKIKAAALVGQSINYTKLEDYEKGLEYGNRALELANYMGDEGVTASVLNNISDIHLAQKEFEKALDAIQKGLNLEVAKKHTKTRGWLLLNKGIALYNLSRYDNSLGSFKASLTLAQEKKLPLIEMYSYEYLAKLYEQQENFEKSFQAQKEYSQIKSAIDGDEKNAAVSDIKHEVKNNAQSLDIAKTELDTARKSQKKLLTYSAVFISLLLIGLLFLIYRKRATELENIDLREKYSSLEKVINQKDNSESVSHSTIPQDSDQPYENSSLTENDRQLHKQRILQLMRLEKPFLDPDLRLPEMAKKLNLSNAHLSEILHYGFKENFHNFINFYRVVEAKKLLEKESQKESKIIAVAFEAGFKSKTTFNRVFKNYTGVTPSEYRSTL